MAKSKPAPAQAPRQVARTKQVKQASSFSFDKFTMWLHLIIIALTFWILYTSIFDHKPDMNGDNFAYMLLGKRLAAGLGFTNATTRELTPHNHFSPGYPAMIALFSKTVGDEQDTVSFMNGIMMFLSVIMTYFITKKLTASPALAFAVAFLCAVNPILLRFSTITMSEVPFVFIASICILTFIMAVDDKRGLKSPWLYVCIANMGFAYYIKSNALAFAAGAGAYFIFARDWKRAVVTLAGFAIIVFPWYLRTKRVGSSYMDQMKFINPYKPELGHLTTPTLITRIYNNIIRYSTCDIPLNIFPSSTSFDKAPLSYWILGIVMLALMIWGLYKLKDIRLFILGYFGGSLAILMVWPTEYGFIRYVTPFTPVILLLLLNGVKELAALIIGESNTKFVPYAFVLLGFIYTKPIEDQQMQADQPIAANYANYFEIAKWAKANTPKDATFSARKPDMFIYYSDRLCVGDKPSLDDKEVMDFFRQNKVDYVVIEQLGFGSTGKYLVPAVQKNMDKFDVVLQLPNPDTYLLKFKDGKKAAN
jgi:hypothetical protein